MALLYLIQEYQNRNMISLWLCPQSALCVYGCVYTHILKWRGHWEGAGVRIWIRDHTLNGPDREHNTWRSWVKANRSNRGSCKKGKHILHQKAFEFDFRKINSANKIKHIHSVTQQGQIQLSVFNPDKCKSPHQSSCLIPSEGGKGLITGPKIPTSGCPGLCPGTAAN